MFAAELVYENTTVLEVSSLAQSYKALISVLHMTMCVALGTIISGHVLV